MISRIVLAMALLMPAFSFAAVTCPLGANETELTINRVMRNFGRYYGPAGDLARKIQDPWDKPADKDFQAAVDGLNVVIACSEAVLANPTDAVLPSKGNLMDPTAKAQLKEYYLYFMGDFHDSVVQFRDLIAKTLATPAAQRDLSAIVTKNEEVNQKINHAHQKL